MTPLFLIILYIAAATQTTRAQYSVDVAETSSARALTKPQFTSFACQRKYTYPNINGLSYSLYIGDDGLIELLYFTNDHVNVIAQSGHQVLH